MDILVLNCKPEMTCDRFSVAATRTEHVSLALTLIDERATTLPVVTDAWFNAVVVVGPFSEFGVYINGVADSNVQAALDQTENPHIFSPPEFQRGWIGNPTEQATLLISDVQVYERRLPDSDIMAIATGTRRCAHTTCTTHLPPHI